ncbi:hypothetical protein CRE_23344 [Caenorhabditis remanei]|uniref:F-box domain-containing protein n=1 Tax=Caenorhabditis remanei TaxID=31234 RepID=E3MGZ1_CAERE|nr:hypothetical protein CRE_23344 [Caenorhabditis remanei]
MPSQTLLVDFPAVVKSKVLEKLDLFSILKLRKVCYNLRQFIDENPPKCNKCAVKVTTTLGECISINMGSPKIDCLDFRPDGNGCKTEWKVSYEVRKVVVEMGNYIDVFLRELEGIMKHWRPVLESFSIQQFEGGVRREVSKELTRIGCVHTDEVVFDGCSLDQIATFLPFFNSDDLNKIRIEGLFKQEKENQEDDFRVLNFQKIKQLEQWKNSKHVKIEAWDFYVKIRDFLNFEQVEIKCEMMSVHDIILLKESFLTSSRLDDFSIGLENYHDREQLYASFGFPSLPVDPETQEEEWFFRIPNNEDVLSVSTWHYFDTWHRFDRNYFFFSRVKVEDVPVDAVIRG